MENMHPAAAFLFSHFGAEISPQQQDYILGKFRKEHVQKRMQLFKQGDVNSRHYIIEQGLLRLYLIDSRGKEINILFAKENQVIGDLATPEPTNFYLEAIEDGIVYSIEERELQSIFEYLSVGNTFYAKSGLRRSYIYIQNRLVSILSKSAEENFLEFQEKHPDLIQRLPQYQIAAFLGISPEFLSKIIAKTARKR